MKRALAVFLLLVSCFALVSPAQAGYFKGAGHSVDVNGEVNVRLQSLKDWTIVTPETVDEHMQLMTSRGDTEQEVRRRFAQGTIAIEAYHPQLPKGRIRLQVFEDEWSRSVWHLDDLTKKQYQALAKELEEHLFQGYLELFNIKYYAENKTNRVFSGSVIAYPPSAYESGLFSLCWYNGKAYLLTYTESQAASSKKLLGRDNTYSRVTQWTDVGGGLITLIADRQSPPAADLRTDQERLILNAHSGPFTFTGLTEKNARVTVQAGCREWTAKVNSDGTYAADITLSSRENVVTVRASGPKMVENTLQRAIRVDDSMASLELMDYPYETVDRQDVKVTGKAAPGARVTIRVDEQPPVDVQVEKDGAFSWPVQVEEWVEHTIDITASEAGLVDCTARFSFRTTYKDVAKGIAAYKKTLTPGVTGQKISANPEEYVGSRVKMEVYTTGVEHTDGRLILRGNIDKNKNRPILLICPDYLEDQILDKMLLTVYGEVTTPAMTAEKTPRLNVEYIQYRKVVYQRRAY